MDPDRRAAFPHKDGIGFSANGYLEPKWAPFPIHRRVSVERITH
jgi:hypothetical protein